VVSLPCEERLVVVDVVTGTGSAASTTLFIDLPQDVIPLAMCSVPDQNGFCVGTVYHGVMVFTLHRAQENQRAFSSAQLSYHVFPACHSTFPIGSLCCCRCTGAAERQSPLWDEVCVIASSPLDQACRAWHLRSNQELRVDFLADVSSCVLSPAVGGESVFVASSTGSSFCLQCFLHPETGTFQIRRYTLARVDLDGLRFCVAPPEGLVDPNKRSFRANIHCAASTNGRIAFWKQRSRRPSSFCIRGHLDLSTANEPQPILLEKDGPETKEAVPLVDKGVLQMKWISGPPACLVVLQESNRMSFVTCGI
jgi:hypothetical protein